MKGKDRLYTFLLEVTQLWTEAKYIVVVEQGNHQWEAPAGDAELVRLFLGVPAVYMLPDVVNKPPFHSNNLLQPSANNFAKNFF